MRFHVSNKDGEVRVCTARTVESCTATAGDETAHFASKEEAYSAIEEKRKGETFTTVSKKFEDFTPENAEQWLEQKVSNAEFEEMASGINSQSRYKEDLKIVDGIEKSTDPETFKKICNEAEKFSKQHLGESKRKFASRRIYGEDEYSGIVVPIKTPANKGKAALMRSFAVIHHSIAEDSRDGQIREDFKDSLTRMSQGDKPKKDSILFDSVAKEVYRDTQESISQDEYTLVRTTPEASESATTKARAFSSTSSGHKNFANGWSWGQDSKELHTQVKRVPKKDILAHFGNIAGAPSERTVLVKDSKDLEVIHQKKFRNQDGV